MNDTDFRKIMQDVMKEKGFGVADLARYAGVEFKDLYRILHRKQSPRSEFVFTVLRGIGWNFERARPDYIVPLPAEDRTGAFEAQIAYQSNPAKHSRSATRLQTSRETSIDGYIDAGSGDVVWRRLRVKVPHLQITTDGTATHLLQVRGTGMSACFPDGTILLATPHTSDDLPHGRYVVLKNNTVRLVRSLSGRKTAYLSQRPGREDFEVSSTAILSVIRGGYQPLQ